MTRSLRIALATLWLVLASSAPPSRAQDPPAAPAPPGGPPPVAARTPDPLEEFVPHERVEADSIVAFPVDI